MLLLIEMEIIEISFIILIKEIHVFQQESEKWSMQIHTQVKNKIEEIRQEISISLTYSNNSAIKKHLLSITNLTGQIYNKRKKYSECYIKWQNLLVTVYL